MVDQNVGDCPYYKTHQIRYISKTIYPEERTDKSVIERRTYYCAHPDSEVTQKIAMSMGGSKLLKCNGTPDSGVCKPFFT